MFMDARKRSEEEENEMAGEVAMEQVITHNMVEEELHIAMQLKGV